MLRARDGAMKDSDSISELPILLSIRSDSDNSKKN